MELFYIFPKNKNLFQLQLVHLSKMSKTNIEKETNLKPQCPNFPSQQPNTHKIKNANATQKISTNSPYHCPSDL